MRAGRVARSVASHHTATPPARHRSSETLLQSRPPGSSERRNDALRSRYTGKAQSEESQKRSLQLFQSWEPPFEFKHHWARANADGGIAVVDTESAEALLEGIAPRTPFFTFDVTPIVAVEDAMPLFAKTNAWRNSVS
jgi:Protein of unknown function (DUF3303)